jgi:hypothetical protein
MEIILLVLYTYFYIILSISVFPLFKFTVSTDEVFSKRLAPVLNGIMLLWISQYINVKGQSVTSNRKKNILDKRVRQWRSSTT